MFPPGEIELELLIIIPNNLGQLLIIKMHAFHKMLKTFTQEIIVEMIFELYIYYRYSYIDVYIDTLNMIYTYIYIKHDIYIELCSNG